MTTTRVLLVDDHAVLCEGLRALLAYADDLQVVGEAHDGRQALVRVAELAPDVALMDIAMPGMNGIEATRLIREQYPGTRVLILTQHEDRCYTLALLKAGASGCVPKRAPGADLVAAIRAVARGETFLHPAISALVVEGMQRSEECLTPREQEVLQRIATGQTNLEIAAAMRLSVKTVEWHRANLMSKLDLHNIADLVRYALQHRLVEEQG